jgi:resuscitation-promoting factor RpfA
MDRSVRFWSEIVGFKVSMQVETFAFLETGSIQLTLNQIDDPPQDDSLTEIVIEVDDVRGAFDELSSRGVSFEVDLRPVTSDGDRELLAAHFHDPDGHLASVVGWVPAG